MKRNVYIALLHHPVYDKNGRVVTTSVTNLDVHDIARLSRTYALSGYFVVTPVEAQRQMVQELLGHWKSDVAGRYNPTRQMAFEAVRVAASFDEVVATVAREDGNLPVTVGTTARAGNATVSFDKLRKRLSSESGSLVIILGTGSGLEKNLVDRMDELLEPISGVDGYNHLSVRSAAAIILDRLLGVRSMDDTRDG